MRIPARLAARLLLVLALSVTVVLSTRIAAAQTTSDVSIINFSYQPDPIHVPVGSTVRWTNQDSVDHTSTSDTGIWDSIAISQGHHFSFTFNSAGTFTY